MKVAKLKVPKPTPARMALASNLRHLMDNYQFGVGIASRSLEKATGKAVSYKTVDRILDPYNDVNPNLNTLDVLAYFFGVETWQLLQPHHGTLTPNTPNGRSDIKVKS